MVIRVFVVGLQEVMIHVLDCRFRLYTVDTQGLRFQYGHGSGGILEKGVVDGNGNLPAGNQVPFKQVRFQDLVRQVFRHPHSFSRL